MLPWSRTKTEECSRRDRPLAKPVSSNLLIKSRRACSKHRSRRSRWLCAGKTQCIYNDLFIQVIRLYHFSSMFYCRGGHYVDRDRPVDHGDILE
ncbi:hypothetical protein TNCV_841211 [Trichonephila clavipes]|nr:hypothetical protein TNCV_841211 [Trichonephila clavipes]